ncbi:hypothetical protein DICPUDRAFT_74128 [Dictyostelium purpureum]|uniref:ABC transporter B family protein n=1 Tax=Dictyostelium purpureum TaxID=5786 RepID=F0Z6Q3_DICPU|nr:uncharacterized protein DICPUDRAFT_74128 [Dictyostelium purpureum]EGC40349.1 hypothetical protein DICPUDRAFT_74128 [Dictyostelium purpureum]|eukprot:XP_003283100.1 hypothetical protein DICPUDRAFT_74128 [Dictyostelium purpureum]
MTKKSNYNYLNEEEDDDESQIAESPMALLDKNNSLNRKKNVKFNLDTPLPVIRDKSSTYSVNNNNNNGSGNNTLPYISDYKDDFDFKRSDYDYDDLEDEDMFDEHSFYKTTYSTRKCLNRLLLYIRPQIWYFAFAFLALSITTLCQLSLPFYFSNGLQQTIAGNAINQINTTIINVTDSGGNPSPTPSSNTPTPSPTIPSHLAFLHIPFYNFDWFELCKVILLIILVQTPFLFIRYLLFTLAGFSVVTKLKRDLFRSMLTQEVSYFDSNRSGDIKAVIASDSSILQNCLTVSLSTLVRCILQSIGGSLVLMFLSWKVTLLLFSFIVVLIGSYIIFKNIIYPRFIYIQDKHVNIGTIIDVSIENIRGIRLLNAESKELRNFETELEALFRASRSFTLLNAFWISLGSLVVMLLIVAIYLFAINETLENNIMLLQYILYGLMVTAAINGLIGSLNELQKLVSSCQRIFSLIDRKPIVHFQGGITPTIEQDITFESVWFHHKNSSTMLLSDISFVVSKGQIVSLVGPSQSKETIFSLVQGLYYPTRGAIYVDRIDSKVLDLYFFRNRLSTITSNTIIFEGTVEQNIRYGLSTLSNQNVIEASKKANLHDFIISLPHGYDSTIGKNNLLNSLQCLKISIARAFLRNPSVLLIDETSLGFDSNEIEESLELLVKNKTSIIIANKLSTLKKSNQILVFDDNRIVERGTHDVLSSNTNSFYSTSVLKQFK